MKKSYVLDTSVLLTDPDSLFSFESNDVILPLKVLDELDNNKKKAGSIGANARQVIRVLDGLRDTGSLHTGVTLGPGLGNLSVVPNDDGVVPSGWELPVPDNMIISTALHLQKKKEFEVVLVSNDINMRVKAAAININVEGYKKEKVISRTDDLYSGSRKMIIESNDINQLYGKMLLNDPFEYENLDKYYFENKYNTEILPNECLTLESDSNSKQIVLARESGGKIKKLPKFGKIQGVKPRNREQKFALDLLLDVNIPIVSLIGKPGSGKTLLAMVAGLEQVLNRREYGKLVVSRPVIPVGNDIGFLPGSLEEKMMPWLAPINDNLEFLEQQSGQQMKQLLEDGTIEISAMTYIRGRSIANAFMIIDEAQQLTQHELKTILTRVGVGTKIVLTGDIKQIDNLYVDETSNGLTYAVEKFKVHGIAGHITLRKGERSEVATLSDDIL